MSKIEILNSRQKSLSEQLNEHKYKIINDGLNNQELATIKIGEEFVVKQEREAKLFNKQRAKLIELKLDIYNTNPDGKTKVIDFDNRLDTSIAQAA